MSSSCRFQRSSKGASVRVALSVLCVSACAGILQSSAAAQAPEPKGTAMDLGTTFKIDDDDPKSSVPTPEQAAKNPLQMGYFVMDLSDRAEKAFARGNHEAALKYFDALVLAAPDRSVGYSKLCATYAALGRRKEAIDQCRAALGRGGVTVADHLRYAGLLLEEPGPLSEATLAEVNEIVLHLEKEANAPGTDLALQRLRCDLALKQSQLGELSRCVSAMQKIAPSDPRTIVYAFTLAVGQNDGKAARLALARARAAQVPKLALDRMERQLATLRTDEPWLAALKQPLVLAAGVATLLLAGFVLLRIRRTRKLRSSQKHGRPGEAVTA